MGAWIDGGLSWPAQVAGTDPPPLRAWRHRDKNLGETLNNVPQHLFGETELRR